MAIARDSRLEKPRAGGQTVAYRTIIVPLREDPGSLLAVPAACALAAPDGGAVIGVFVIEVPSELPLEAHMFHAERRARDALGQARAAAEEYGLRFSGRIVRAHGPAEAIVAEAERLGADLIVMAARRRPVRRRGAPLFDETVRAVLTDAPCRVSIIATSQLEAGRVAGA
jgi:nucleotide-binding universal stress UspA family protein